MYARFTNKIICATEAPVNILSWHILTSNKKGRLST